MIAILTLAGCGGGDSGTAPKPAKTQDASAWADKASDLCEAQVPAIERAGTPIPRAVAAAQQGAPGGWKKVAAQMGRQSDAITKLYEDLKALPAPKDARVRRFLYLYANVAGGSFRAVDGMLYDRDVAQQYIADANAAGQGAHEIAHDLGVEACTRWLVAA